MKYLKRLKLRHWAWLHFLTIIGIAWPSFMLVTPPEVISDAVHPAILTVAYLVSLFGSIVAFIGYFASQQLDKIGVIGVSLELSGLVLSVVGPATYLFVRLYLLTLPDATGLLNSPLFFSYALCAVYLYRFIIVVPRFRFEARDPSKE